MKFKQAHEKKSKQYLQDLKLQQALYHGYAKERIVNVNELKKADEET